MELCHLHLYCLTSTCYAGITYRLAPALIWFWFGTNRMDQKTKQSPRERWKMRVAMLESIRAWAGIEKKDLSDIRLMAAIWNLWEAIRGLIADIIHIYYTNLSLSIAIYCTLFTPARARYLRYTYPAEQQKIWDPADIFFWGVF